MLNKGRPVLFTKSIESGEEFIKKNVTEFRKDIYQEVLQIFSKTIKDYN